MRNLDNLRQAVEIPESWNSVGYICQKNTFLQLKHIQRIYLTLLSTTCVKIHQIPCHFWAHKLFFTTQLTYYFSSSITYFWQKYPIKVQIFRFPTTWVKIHQISRIFFQTKNEFLFKVWITLQCHER